MSAKFDVDFKSFVENTNADETEIGENKKNTTLKNDSDIREYEKEWQSVINCMVYMQ
jgi:hypothetical protein